ncbi:MAG: SdrD B-like domain-containing protein, partial [Mycobacterium sp.]|nr:SdrD B-like domain-containing protein [Mycobacterium sp.]
MGDSSFGSPPVTSTVGIESFGTPAQVNEDDSFTGQGTTVAAQERQTFSGLVAMFNETSLSGNNWSGWIGSQRTSDFNATIDWGDGTTTAGTVTWGDYYYGDNGMMMGVANMGVSGSHTYAEDGSYTIRVSLVDDDSGNEGFAVTASANAVSSVIVAESDLDVQAPSTISEVEGQASSVVVATLTDGGDSISNDDLSATIDWGDGTTTSGTIVPPELNGPGSLAGVSTLVIGNHAYSDEGHYSVTVTVQATNVPNSQVFTGHSTAVVGEGDVLTPHPLTVTPVERQQFSGTVATFSDSDTVSPASAFSATIDWGDGTTTTGDISGGSGSFTVSGDHSYGDEGQYAVVVTLAENAPGTAMAVANSTAAVADGDVLDVQPVTFNTPEGQTFNGTVADFTDVYFDASSTDFTATIDWGDHTTTSGTIAGGWGQFSVSGSHRYTLDEGQYPVIVTISESAPGTTAVTAQSTVVVTEGDVLAGSALSLTADVGEPFIGMVADFGNQTLIDGASDFSAIINWGDGTTTAGTMEDVGCECGTAITGSYDVWGTHQYAAVGQYSVTVTMGEDAPGTATATVVSTMVVSTPPIPNPAELAGYVFEDINQDGNPEDGELKISGAIVTLDGVDNQNQHVHLAVTTQLDGLYVFRGIAAGTYTLTDTLPQGYVNETSRVGDLGGVAALGSISQIVVPETSAGLDYDFGAFALPLANSPPHFTSTAPSVANAGVSYSYEPTVADDDGDL